MDISKEEALDVLRGIRFYIQIPARTPVSGFSFNSPINTVILGTNPFPFYLRLDYQLKGRTDE